MFFSYPSAFRGGFVTKDSDSHKHKQNPARRASPLFLSLFFNFSIYKKRKKKKGVKGTPGGLRTPTFVPDDQPPLTHTQFKMKN